MTQKENRDFGFGEVVRVSQKSRVVDKDRVQEGLGQEDRRSIDQDVTSVRGEICASPYSSPLKDGKQCVPIRLANGAVVGVPEDRLERDEPRPTSGWSRRFANAWERIFGRKGKG